MKQLDDLFNNVKNHGNNNRERTEIRQRNE